MWQQIVECSSVYNVAFCIPWFGGGTLAIFWYGILASLGIFAGTFYGSKHIEMEGEDPDIMFDVLLVILIPALLGARLWYVAQVVMSTASHSYSLADPIGILNPRDGGMNIFGGALFGIIALMIFVRVRKLKGWLLSDAALLGLLLGQGIGRFGNRINLELYGPPTGSTWFGMLVPNVNARLSAFKNLELYPLDTTRFHATMFYEAFLLFLFFGVLVYLFRKNQVRFQHGYLTGFYFIGAGVIRFIIETWRPDQQGLSFAEGGLFVSYSRMISIAYIIVGLVVYLDRTGHLRIPGIPRSESKREREKSFEMMRRDNLRREKTQEKERIREQRRKERRQSKTEATETTLPEPEPETSDS